jgi:tRNA (Thr-GGU) A37 N-methylase
VAEALHGIAPGDELIVLTWLHQANRKTLQVHPRSDPNRRSPECLPRARPIVPIP